MSAVIAILPYELRHRPDLASISLDELVFPLGREAGNGQKIVADLHASDHLIVNCCSTAFRRSHQDIRCKVSLIMREPRAVQRRYYFLVPFFARKFFRVLTYDSLLLRLLGNAIFVPAGDAWVAEKTDSNKPKLMSVIASKKMDLPGHRLRHEAIKFAQENHLELDTFGRAYRFIEKKEEALSDYRFSLVIENSRQANYFTEKVIDCFLQKTIPIYWGAPNIAEFFDKDGIVACSTLDDIKRAFTTVDSAFYEKRREAVEKNFQLAKSYADWRASAAAALRHSISEKNS